MADHRELYSGSGYSNPKTWDALVELVRAIVTLADRDGGTNCDYASVHVSDWGAIDDGNAPGKKIEMRHIDLHLSMPAHLADRALIKAGVLKHDDELGKDQEIRFSLIEME